MYDYYVDGHAIAARNPEEAAREVQRLYGHTPEIVRPWTADDEQEN